MMDERKARERALELVQCATAAGLTVATAESCTAGLVASTIASIPGASEVLRGGAVTYVDEIKHQVLGVHRETLAIWSAVSEPCAREMAVGARRVFESSIAVSVTGYAGPGGGTDADPVGTVYLGCADEHGTRVERCHFEGERDEVRWQAAVRALELLIAACGDNV